MDIDHFICDPHGHVILQDQVTRACQDQFGQCFSLSVWSPLHQGQLAEYLGTLSDIDMACRILENSYSFAVGMDSATVALLKEAAFI